MSETTKFMKWDGLCFEDATQATNQAQWRNQDSLGKVPSPPVQAQGNTAPSSTQGSGPTLSAQEAEVVLVCISENFAPIEEYAILELSFKNIKGIGCLVLQIHDADKQLVYAERLTRDMVLKLPDSEDSVVKLDLPLARSTLNAEGRKKRRDAIWASPVGTPYTVSLWVTDKLCDDSTKADQLALDVKAESRSGSNFVEKHKPKNPGTLPPPPLPQLPADQTSVRLTGVLKPTFVPWEQAFEYLTGKEFPKKVKELSDDEKLLWAKCRLNQLGFSAGPIDTKKDQEDYVKAVKRYGAMRGVGGKVHYTVKLNPDDSLSNETVDKAFDSLTAADFAVLVGHLEKEGQLAKSIKPLSAPEKLGDGGSEPLKVYIDGNWFYVGDTDSHAKDANERQWLTPPCLPLRPLLHVLSRDGKKEIDIPEVLEPVFFQWTWRAPVEDTERLPDPAAPGTIKAFNGNFDEAVTFGLTGAAAAVYAKPQYRSKTRTYLDVARRRVKEKAPGQHDPLYNNAPKCVGGLIGDAPSNIQAVLKTCEKDPAKVEHAVKERSASDLEPYLLPAGKITDTNSPSSKGAVSVPGGRVYFCPSLIAGDQYQLTVELFFEQQRTKSRANFATNSSRMEELKALNVPPSSAPRFKGSTRQLEGWRRLRMAKFIQWGEQSKTWDGKTDYNRDAAWEAVKREYGFAYMEFQDDALPTCTPGDLVLDDKSDFATPPSAPTSTGQAKGTPKAPEKKLKNGCAFLYGSMEDAVTGKLPQCTANHMIGRQHVPPTPSTPPTPSNLSTPSTQSNQPTQSTPPPPPRFSPDYMLPPLNVKDVTLAGQLPQLSDVLALVFLPVLQLYKKIQSNSLSGEELERFRAAYLLVQEWGSLDPQASLLHKAVQDAGSYVSTGLAKVIEYTPAREGGTFSWKKSSNKDVDPKTLGDPFDSGTGDIVLTQTAKTLIDVAYTHEKFAELMDHFFLPDVPEGTRAELTSWVKGNTLEATRTLGLDALIKPVYPPLFNSNISDYATDKKYFAAWALHRFHEYFGWILDGTTGFKNLPAEHRNLMLCLVHPTIVETTVHNALYANPATVKLGGNLAVVLDQIVRKGLLCRTDEDDDHDDQYKSFSDGIIVLNARVYPTITVGGRAREVPGPSMGFPLGFVLTSHQSTSEPYALLAHEIAHVLYLSHDRNAGTVSASGFIFDHDHDDLNCMMSYPLNEVPGLASIPPTGNSYETNRLTRFVYLHIAGWQSLVDTMNATGKWKSARGSPEFMGNFGENAPVPINRPHFCGKCTLRLRGWDIYSPSPEGSGGSQQGGPPSAASFKWDEQDNLGPVKSGHPDLLPISSRAPLHKMAVNRQYPGVAFDDVAGEEFTVEDGQSLCCIAMAMGHKNCSPIWSHPRNAGLTAPFVGKTVYVPRRRRGDPRGTVPGPPTLHFIRGSNAAERELQKLNISNCHPNDGLGDGDGRFPDGNVRMYNADAYADEDVFQIEVNYPITPPAGSIKGLLLAARKPLYDGSGVPTGQHEDFSEQEQTERSLQLELSAYPTGPNGPNRVRSPYVRLVSLAAMKQERPAQTLLIRDFFSVKGRGAQASLWVEPLDQKVRASFTISGCGCKPGQECKAVPVEVPLEPAKKTVDLSIRILRKDPNGKVATMASNTVYTPTAPKTPGDDNQFIKIYKVQQQVMTNVRNIMAQAHVKVRLVRLETVDPPSDMITVENDEGQDAKANFNIAIGLNVKRFAANGTATDDPLRTVRPEEIWEAMKPFDTATEIVKAINQLRVPGLQAEAVRCQPMGGSGFEYGIHRAADVFLRCDAGTRATLTLTEKNDDAQKIEIVSINPEKAIVDNSPRYVHVGSAQQRLLFYAFDTGGTNIDVVFVNKISNRSDQAANGYAVGEFPDAHSTHPDIRPHPKLRNSIIMSQESLTSPYLMIHEVGHVLIGTSMHVLDGDNFKTALMWGNPGEPGIHATINGHAPAQPNWMDMKWDAEGNLIIDPIAAGSVKINAVARILSHPCAHA
jgi:hypothetical protein